MAVLYHYTKVDKLEPIINSGGLLMDIPDSFNDPYDCVLFHDEDDKKEIHELIKNYVMFLELSDFFTADRHYKKIKDKALIGIVKKEIQCMISLMKKDLTYKFLPFLNILADKIIKNDDHLKCAYDKSIEDWDNKIKNIFVKMRRNTVVACLSKRNDSILMWSHYSDHHKGICLEYEVEDDSFLREVDYSKKLVGIKLKRVMSNILALDYLKRNHIEAKNNFSFDDELYRPFYTKSPEWAYEQEVRYMFYKEDINKRIKMIDGKYYLVLGKPKAVYLGSKVQAKDAEELTKLAGNYGIKCHKTRMSKKKYEIEFE